MFLGIISIYYHKFKIEVFKLIFKKIVNIKKG
jgi:hypothetical protein